MKWMAMIRNGLVLGSLGCLAGCDVRETQQPWMCEEPLPSSQGKRNGVGGTNGLDATAFHLVSGELLDATKVALAEPTEDMPLVQGKEYPVSQTIKDQFLKDGPLGEHLNGREVRQDILDHAIQCALPDGIVLSDGERLYKGKGLLTTTAGWFKGGLEKISYAEDLFTCLAILLNPAHKNVPVFLSGPSVDKRDESPPYVEALWAVDLTPGSRSPYHVWPILDVRELTNCAGENVTNEDLWKYRVCGSSMEYCGLEVHMDLWETDCQEVEFIPFGEDLPVPPDGSHFECLVPQGEGLPPIKKHAIRTALTDLCEDVKLLFCPAQ